LGRSLEGAIEWAGVKCPWKLWGDGVGTLYTESFGGAFTVGTAIDGTGLNCCRWRAAELRTINGPSVFRLPHTSHAHDFIRIFHEPDLGGILMTVGGTGCTIGAIIGDETPIGHRRGIIRIAGIGGRHRLREVVEHSLGAARRVSDVTNDPLTIFCGALIGSNEWTGSKDGAKGRHLKVLGCTKRVYA
jgi:hypothetical protein